MNQTDPSIHYQLFTVYTRLKRKQEAERELAAFKRLEEARKQSDGASPVAAGAGPNAPAALPAAMTGESGKKPAPQR